MGLFDRIFGKNHERQTDDVFKTLTAYTPAFTSWNGMLYESELVRAAIDARARHISKLGISFIGSAKQGMQSRMKASPNTWQTWSQYLYRLSTILDAQNTAFIVPVLDEYGEVNGVYPVLPSRCELVQYKDVPYLRYMFSSGDRATIEMSKCGIMTKFQYKDDFFGENNSALNPTMELIHAQNEGIKEGVSSAATYRFMAKMSNFAKPEDIAKERKNFTEKNFRSGDGGGLLLFPNTYTDIKQIDSKPFTIDSNQMNLIQQNVFNYFGVSADILQNKANDDMMDAFFNGAVEPFSIQATDVHTKMLYTARERAVGNQIVFNANRLQYMSVSHKINMATQLGDRGMILIDEIRALFNYPPLPDGAGQKAPIRGEYYFSGETGEENNDN